MALDDVIDGAKDDTKSSKAQELAEELGVEDKEDLEELNERVETLSNIIISLDKEVEKLSEQVTMLRSVVLSSGDPEVKDEAESEEDEEGWSL